MNDLKNEEQELKENFDNIEIMPFEKKFAKIESRLKGEKKSKKTLSKFQKLIVVTAGLAVFITAAVMVYYSFLPADSFLYGDSDIQRVFCSFDELKSTEGVSLPDFDILTIESNTSNLGKHKETGEIIYLNTKGSYDNGVSFREIDILIILKKEYSGDLNKPYNDLTNSLIVSGKTISYSKPKYEEPFYSFYVKYVKDDVRYYFNYKTFLDYETIEEDNFKDDLNDFFGKFLK